MAEQTLKPWPFCGASALDVKEANPNYYVVCRNCGAEGPEAEASELACSHWNTRPIDGRRDILRFFFLSPSMESPKRKRISDVKAGVLMIDQVKSAVLKGTAVRFDLSKGKGIK